MSAEANIECVRQWVEQVWNTGNLDRLADFHPATFVNHGQLATVEDAQQWHTRSRLTFPDIHYTIDDIFSVADRVALRWTATATQRGAMWDIVPATGKTITWTGMHLLRIVDQRIVEVWALADTVAQLQQMGVTLQPARTDNNDSAV